MKNLFICASLIIALGFNSAAFSYEYTNEQKNAIYDLFISSYIAEVTQQVQANPMPQEKKQQIINFAKNNINRQELMNETWGCIQSKSLTDQMGLNSCFVSWGRKQSADLTEFMLRMSP